MVRSFFCLFFAFYAARFAAKKNKMTFLAGPRRLSVRAVKTAFCAFIGAKRRVLTEGADGSGAVFRLEGHLGKEKGMTARYGDGVREVSESILGELQPGWA
jgi:hypothetical protein